MAVAEQPVFAFENTFAAELGGLYEPWQAAAASAPRLLALNDELARELGAEPSALRTPKGTAALVGALPEGSATPIAQAYSGHQFGGFSPRLGDGRALLLGEVLDSRGRRRDIHLKGSGRTPFARGGDGRAAVGPMLREYVVSEAMHALGIPTTRALAVVATGDQVIRETPLPGAVLARVASSHLRVGTFEYAVQLQDAALMQRLADYSIARHFPGAREAANPYLAFFEEVLEAQAALVARWMLVGFVHGVMNTDNMAISGETIDYGPCAFIDAFDPAAVFSSIDHGGRYAFGNQPRIAQWNLARLAETMLGLFGGDKDRAVADATGILESFPGRYRAHWGRGMRAKLGLTGEQPGDDELIDELLVLLHGQAVDFTSFFRALSEALRGEEERIRSLVSEPGVIDAWLARWRRRLDSEAVAAEAVAGEMERVNPAYIPRNHLVEEALESATAGDLDPLGRLVEAVSRPFDERPGLEDYAEPAPASFGTYRTFCGT
jgi:uncharacterized protein YdiU (UPF0061 family)